MSNDRLLSHLPVPSVLDARSGENPRELLVQRNTRPPTRHVWKRPFLLIGRSKRCDIPLEHPDVSYRHALLQRVAGRVLCIDLASRTGVFWRGSRRHVGWLEPGEPVSIGPYSIASSDEDRSGAPGSEFDDDFDAAVMLSSSAVPAEALCGVRLIPLNCRRTGGGGEAVFVKQPITLVGSHRRCKMRLDVRGVSRVHCCLFTTASEVWVADLLGRGGTVVNDREVDFVRLQDDDVLQIGPVRLRVEYGAGVAGAGPKGSPGVRRSGARSAWPRPPRREDQPEGSLSERMLLALFDSFSQMQQQMLAQNHEQMLLLTHLVASLSHGQYAHIRDDVARIHEITTELQQIREALSIGGRAAPPDAEALASAAAPAGEPGGWPPASLPPELRGIAGMLQGGGAPQAGRIASPFLAAGRIANPSDADARRADEGSSESEGRESRIEDRAEDQSRLTSDGEAGMCEPVQSPAIESHGGESDTAVTDDAADADESAFEPEAPAADEDSDEISSTGGSEADRPSAAGRPRTDDVESHARLFERMVELEKERSSRWRKLMRLLSGSGAG